MAISVPNLFHMRKFPLLFFFMLFLCVLLFIVFSSSDSPFSSSSNSPFSSVVRQRQQLPPISPPSPSQSPPNLSSPSPSSSEEFEDLAKLRWQSCKGSDSVDRIPCLDNWKAIKKLKSRRHMEHRERHCPSPIPRCLVPLPHGYAIPIPWPRSRDMIWYNNVPHPKLVEYKKDQNWVRRNGDYLQFPGGGTQFKHGVSSYINFIEENMPDIKWGKNIRVILDVGCGVASFGGYLLDKNVTTMSFAPKDEHEAQIQFALERGIPAFLSVIGTQKLTFPDNAYDLIHCARCRVHWDADGGAPLMELNRILRPGGFFIWSATPVYKDNDRDRSVWNAMVSLTEAMCWKVVSKINHSGIGIVIYQKPVSSDCYEQRQVQKPPVCETDTPTISWYTPLGRCLPKPTERARNWPLHWPERLNNVPVSLQGNTDVVDAFTSNINRWSQIVSSIYLNQLGIKWDSVRNVMDMNAAYGGFAATLSNKAAWVMNVVPVHEADTLGVVFDRGLIGTYHDWCESFSTYPRSYDLVHSNFLFTDLPERCEMIDVLVEVDRILRPEGWLVVVDTKELLLKSSAILRSLQWTVKIHQECYLVGQKGFWRPIGGHVHR